MADVVVAGGGLAGLVAARYLAEAGADVRLFERHADLGGRVRSARRGGFVFDRGFQVLFTAYPAARRELDYDALDLRRFAPGAVLVRPGHRGTLADPFRDPLAAVETLFNRDVTALDKLRVLQFRRELAEKSDEEIFGGPDATTREHLRERGFSEAFVSNFAEPFFGGVTLDRGLSTSRKAFEFAFKMLAFGDIAVPARGMGAISDQLADRVRAAGVAVHVDETVTDVEGRIRTDGDSPRGGEDADGTVTVGLGRESTSADAVVVATDPRGARELAGVDAIPTDGRGCVTQYYAFEGPQLDAGKRILLNTDSDAPNQVVQLSAVAPEYAPGDRELLGATFLGVPEDPDEALADCTARALGSWYPERRLDLELLHTSRIEFAQFAQPPGVYDSLPDVRDPDGSVYLAGEYTEASSLNGAMRSGRRAARAVVDDLDLQ